MTMVRAGGIRGYVATMRSLGVDPHDLLRRYHIEPTSLDNDDTPLSLLAVVHLLEASAAAANCPDLGLRISMHQDITVLGLLGIMLQNAATMRDVMEYSSRYVFLHGPGLSISIIDPSPLIDGAAEMVFAIRLKGHPVQKQTIDLCLATSHRITQWLCGSHYDLKAVSLPHTPTAPLSEYRQFFGAPIIVNQERAALHISYDTLRMQPHSANPALREITEDYLARHFRIPSDTISARVRKALRLNLGTPQANKTDISAMLAVHPRTLQRRLEMEGTSFETVKEDVRRELALQYLKETQISLGQLTGLLGFPEQSAFSRAAKRWFGVTPSEIRKKKDGEM